MNQTPKIKVMCIIRHGNKILVARCFDKNDKPYLRLLGGNVKPYEKSINALKREFKEELKSDLINISFIKTIENIFIYKKRRGHQIIFLYKVELKNKKLYKTNSINVTDGDYKFGAVWKTLKEIEREKIPLFPELNYEQIISLTKNG